MHCTRKIKEDLYFIGSEDRRLNLFENMFPIPNGVSYNSYLLVDEKTVLLDTVDYSVGKQFLENLDYVLNGRNLDYLIINHMEPDHSSIIKTIVKKFPNVTIIGNMQTIKMLKQFFEFNEEPNIQIVKENDTLNTGNHILRFIFAPMVHWPEVMFTYDETSKMLFSADAFGTFGALNGNIFNDDTNFEKEYLDEARRYYTNIVGKYGMQVQNIFKKLENTEIKMICPLHGPIWRNNLPYILDKYDKWSKYLPEEKSIIILYSSVYGNTENLANIVANKLAENGIKNLKVYDVSNTDNSILVSESFRCSHIVLLSTTYNMGIFPKMKEYISDIKRMNLQNRTFAIIENSTWSPGISNKIRDKIQEMQNMTVLDDVFAIKSSLKSDQMECLNSFINNIVEDFNK